VAFPKHVCVRTASSPYMALWPTSCSKDGLLPTNEAARVRLSTVHCASKMTFAILEIISFESRDMAEGFHRADKTNQRESPPIAVCVVERAFHKKLRLR
jgi:hypothetical protein